MVMAQRVGVVASEVDSAATKVIRDYQSQQSKIAEKFPTVDSAAQIALMEQYNKLSQKCNSEVFAIYAKHIAAGEYYRQMVFNLRTMVDRAALVSAFKKIKGKDKTESPYAVSIKKFIDSKQIIVGGSCVDFTATTHRGDELTLGEIVVDKNVLLIFGPAQMDDNAMALLKMLYSKADYSMMEVIAFSLTATNLDELKEEVKLGNGLWVNVSDFKGEHSDVNIAYNIVSVPTFVFINKGGAINFISQGISQDVFAAFAKE